MVRIPGVEAVAPRSLYGELRPEGGTAIMPESSIPSALKQVGQGVADLGRGIAAVAKEKESSQTTLDVTMATAHMNKRAAELDDAFDARKDQDYGTWHKRHTDEISKAREEAANMIKDPERRALFIASNEGNNAMRSLRIKSRADEQLRAAGISQIDGAADDNLTAATAPGATKPESDRIAGQVKASYDAGVRTGMFTPEEAKARYEKWLSRRDRIGIDREIEKDPVAVVGKLGGDVGYFRSLRMQESGGNDAARAGTSSAVGRYQFLTSTWNGIANSEAGRAAGLRPVGAGGDQRLDAQAQEAAIRIFTGQNASGLAAAGIEANDKNLYLAHFMGLGGATKLIRAMQANPDAPAVTLFPAEAQANPTIFHKARGEGAPRSVREVYDLQTRKFGGGGGKTYTASDDSFASNLSAEERASALRRAENGARRMEAETRIERETVKNLMSDDLASMRATGIGVGEIDMRRVESAMGREAAAQWDRERRSALLVHDTTKDFVMMPAAQIADAIERTKPTPGAVGFTEQQSANAEIAKEAQRVLKQRDEDPAAAVESAPTVQAAMRTAMGRNDTASREALVQARIVAQQTIGVPEHRIAPAPMAEVSGYAKMLRQMSEGQSKMADQRRVAEQIAGDIGQKYGQYAGQVLKSVLYQLTLSDEASGVMKKVFDAAITGKPVSVRPDEAASVLTAGRENTYAAVREPRVMLPLAGSESVAQQQQGNNAPPQSHVDALIRNSNAETKDGQRWIADFDAMYGKGAAYFYLKAHRDGLKPLPPDTSGEARKRQVWPALRPGQPTP